MALDTVLFHHLLLDQPAFGLEPFDAAQFLRKQAVADVAITQYILVAMMGKRDNPAASTL
jgi:hypothetical protein